MELNIVLVNPDIPPNTGNVVRTCAVTGARLHIVKPMGFSTDDKHLKRAGLDYWRLLDLTYYDSIGELFAKNPDGEFRFFSSKAVNNYCEVSYPDKVFIVFGNEDRGLPELMLLRNEPRCVRIPMIYDDRARCLNLSNSVAVGAYEVLRQWGFPKLNNYGRLDEYDWSGTQKNGDQV